MLSMSPFLATLDHLTNTYLEFKWLTPVITGIKFLAILQGACVVHAQHVPVPGHPITGVWLADILHFQSRILNLGFSQHSSHQHKNSKSNFHFVVSQSTCQRLSS